MAILQERLYHNSDIGDRLALVRKRAGITQKQLAEAIAVHWQTISRIENGQRRITAEILIHFCELGYDATWLRTGKGEMFLADEGNVEQQRLSAEYWQKNHETLVAAVKLAYKRLVDSNGEEQAREIFKETITIANLE